MKLTESHISLNALRFHAYHGVLPQEKVVGNDYLVDLVIGYNVAAAVENDDISMAINYADVWQTVREVMLTPCQLIETVAANICKHLEKQFPQMTSLEVTVTKLNPPVGGECQGASVKLCYK